MIVDKKVAGFAVTLGDLKEFIEAAEKEGFSDSTILNPKDKGAKVPHGVHLYVRVNEVEDPDIAPVAESDYEGKCRECRQVVPASSAGVALTHYRGETRHPDAQCYGVGQKVTGLVRR